MPDAFVLPLFVVPDVDDIAELELVAGLCRRVSEAKANRSISFSLGLFPDSTVFFDDQGVFHSPDPKIGLTCASFVLKIFSKAKIPLIQISNWPRRPEKDEPEQESLIRLMERALHAGRSSGQATSITQEKIDFNKRQVGKPRVAPEEVAGASLEQREDLPANCPACERNGREIVDLLDRLRYSRTYSVPLFYVPSPSPPLDAPR